MSTLAASKTVRKNDIGVIFTATFFEPDPDNPDTTCKPLSDQQLFVGLGILSDKDHQAKQASGPNVNVQYVIIQPPGTTEIKDVTDD